ncbi:MAG: hypothetical protein WCI11_02920 [Candidatus Methylumidiphilus sp.]
MLTDRQMQQLRNDGWDDVADHINQLRDGIRLVIAAQKTGGMTGAELAALEEMIDVPNDRVEGRGDDD